jgi:DNA-binding protein H-NS
MSEYAELQSQIAALQKRADEIRLAERQAAIKTITELVATFGIVRSDIKFAGASTGGNHPQANAAKKRHPSAGQSVPPRFRDATGNSWAGRGLQPKWLREAIAAGATLESFRVE